jgi:hypothetical protein
MSVPWSDPQFWVVTLLVAAAVLGLVRSLRRASGSEQEDPGCSHCALAPGNRVGQQQGRKKRESETRTADPSARAS